MRDITPVWTHYQDTILTFEGESQILIDLREVVGNREMVSLERAGLEREFAIVTACDPLGTALDSAVNQLRTGMLQVEIERLGAPRVPVQACNPDGLHCEASFAISLGLHASIALAARYDQLAIFWFDGVSFWIIPVCSNNARVRLPVRP